MDGQGKVIKTKSVEFMPITLSIFLTLNAIMWFFYGFLKKDFFIAVSGKLSTPQSLFHSNKSCFFICLMYPYMTQVPNVLGFLLGGVQMAFYAIYRKKREVVVEQQEVEVVVEEQQEVEVVVEQLQEVEVVEEQQEVEVVVEQLQEVREEIIDVVEAERSRVSTG